MTSIMFPIYLNPSLGFTEIGPKQRKYPVNSSSVGKNEVRGEWTDWFLTFAFTFMHLADAFIQSNLQCIQVIHFFFISMAILS